LPGGAKPESAALKISYSSVGKNSFVFHIGSDGCYAGGYNTAWYPQLDEHRALGTIVLEVPEGYVAKATGHEAPKQASDGLVRYTFNVIAPSVLTFAAAKYQVIKIDGKFPVTIYSLSRRENAQAYADGCRKILEVLQKMYGPYPYSDFAIIETPSPVSIQTGFSGASFEGFMFADTLSMNLPFSYAYYGHEMGHQWWGNCVQRNGKKGEGMLDEALAQYGSLQVVDQIQGPAMAAKYRSTGYPYYSPSQSGRGAIMTSATEYDMPLATMPENSSVTHEVADEKGFLAWDAIAQWMGRDHFHAALREVVTKHAFGYVTFDEFLDTVSAKSPVPLDKILDQWLNRTGLPVLSISGESVGSEYVVKVTQTKPYYFLKIPVEVVTEDGESHREIVSLEGESGTVSLKLNSPVSKVLLDPQFEILHSTPELQDEAEKNKAMTRKLMLRLQGKA